MTDDNKRVYKSVKTGKRFTISTPHHTEPNQQGGKRGDTSDNWGDKPNQLDDRLWLHLLTYTLVKLADKRIDVATARDKIDEYHSQLIDEAQTEELTNLPTPKIDEINHWANKKANLCNSKQDAWIQGARFMRNRVQKYRGNRIAQLNRKDNDV